MDKIEVWIVDLHILCIASKNETIRVYFPTPLQAIQALEKLLESPDCKFYG